MPAYFSLLLLPVDLDVGGDISLRKDATRVLLQNEPFSASSCRNDTNTVHFSPPLSHTNFLHIGFKEGLAPFRKFGDFAFESSRTSRTLMEAEKR